MLTVFWLVVVALMLVIEIITMGLTTIWFALGAVAATIAASLGATLWVQIVLFCIVSVVVMLLVRPFALKVMNRDRTKTNVEEVIGKKAEVIEAIDNLKGKGKVRFRGVEWTARSEAGDMMDVGTIVTIQRVAGVTLYVTRI